MSPFANYFDNFQTFLKKSILLKIQDKPLLTFYYLMVKFKRECFTTPFAGWIK